MARPRLTARPPPRPVRVRSIGRVEKDREELRVAQAEARGDRAAIADARRRAAQVNLSIARYHLASIERARRAAARSVSDEEHREARQAVEKAKRELRHIAEKGATKEPTKEAKKAVKKEKGPAVWRREARRPTFARVYVGDGGGGGEGRRPPQGVPRAGRRGGPPGRRPEAGGAATAMTRFPARQALSRSRSTSQQPRPCGPGPRAWRRMAESEQPASSRASARMGSRSKARSA